MSYSEKWPFWGLKGWSLNTGGLKDRFQVVFTLNVAAVAQCLVEWFRVWSALLDMWSARRQKDLTGYCFKDIDRLFCL